MNTKKYTITLLLALGLTPVAFSQKSPASKQTLQLNKEIALIVKKNSMFSKQLNWKEIEKEAQALPLTANDSVSQQMLYSFYTGKLRKAGDKHSFFISSKRIEQIAQAPVAEQPQGAYLGEGVGWVKVPRCLTFDDKKDVAFANDIRDIIKKIDTENTITGWVVDLRHNTGGNMWPMLAGLNALIDDGTAGYFVEGKSGKKTPWENKNGIVSGEGKLSNDYKIRNNKVKIAVLIDGRTGSSGEMTAVSMLGLPNVKTFGQTSAGYVTANYTFHLVNGAQLLLAMNYVADRTGKGYRDEIKPDVTVDDLSNTINDKVVQMAKQWLAE